MLRDICSAAGLATMLGAPVAAADQDLIGDAERGAELAAEHCVRCHDITEDGAFKTYPPSFASIAVYRPDDQIFARIYFPQMHNAMPEFSWYLQREGVEDLVAYIRSLERPID